MEWNNGPKVSCCEPQPSSLLHWCLGAKEETRGNLFLHIISQQERIFLFSGQRPGREIKKAWRLALSPAEQIFQDLIQSVVLWSVLWQTHPAYKQSLYSYTHSGGVLTCAVGDPGSIVYLNTLPACQQSLVVRVSDKPATLWTWGGKNPEGGKSDCHTQLWVWKRVLMSVSLRWEHQLPVRSSSSDSLVPVSGNCSICNHRWANCYEKSHSASRIGCVLWNRTVYNLLLLVCTVEMFLSTLLTLEKLKAVAAGALHDVRLRPAVFCHTAPVTPSGQAVGVRVRLGE